MPNTTSAAPIPRVTEASPPSTQSRVLGNTLRMTLRGVGAILPANRLGVGLLRVGARVALPAIAGARSATVRQVHARFGGRPVLGEWVRGGGRQRPDAALLYLHGSGYVCCSARTHRGLVAQLSSATGIPAFALNYR
ncbi:MAG: alpha/beta hydrolase, partial [Sciscionella sp.]